MKETEKDKGRNRKKKRWKGKGERINEKRKENKKTYEIIAKIKNIFK